MQGCVFVREGERLYSSGTKVIKEASILDRDIKFHFHVIHTDKCTRDTNVYSASLLLGIYIPLTQDIKAAGDRGGVIKHRKEEKKGWRRKVCNSYCGTHTSHCALYHGPVFTDKQKSLWAITLVRTSINERPRRSIAYVLHLLESISLFMIKSICCGVNLVNASFMIAVSSSLGG